LCLSPQYPFSSIRTPHHQLILFRTLIYVCFKLTFDCNSIRICRVSECARLRGSRGCFFRAARQFGPGDPIAKTSHHIGSFFRRFFTLNPCHPASGVYLHCHFILYCMSDDICTYRPVSGHHVPLHSPQARLNGLTCSPDSFSENSPILVLYFPRFYFFFFPATTQPRASS
jgi:hypothetical protein